MWRIAKILTDVHSYNLHLVLHDWSLPLASPTVQQTADLFKIDNVGILRLSNDCLRRMQAAMKATLMFVHNHGYSPQQDCRRKDAMIRPKSSLDRNLAVSAGQHNGAIGPSSYIRTLFWIICALTFCSNKITSGKVQAHMHSMAYFGNPIPKECLQWEQELW